MLEAVPSRITIGSRRRRKYLAGAMNSLLLLLIFYGATCGLIHSHSVSTRTASTYGTTLDGAREADLTTQLLSNGKTCLLCQFHQQLSYGLFQTTPFAQQPPARRPLASLPHFTGRRPERRGACRPQRLRAAVRQRPQLSYIYMYATGGNTRPAVGELAGVRKAACDAAERGHGLGLLGHG